ncbi:hypothetical protein [Sphingopyxis sp. NFH-91]|uniref:hypothetical protein n=1 Tax=Sphingopyxis sp. NFH-91 TaxID=2744457 RepID=UPI001F1FDEF1|nr:hypothetical protein [Sphingopyxis sp. NFH-91]
MSSVTITAPARPAANSLTAWQSLMAAYEAAKTADDEVNARFDAAWAAYEAGKPAEPDIDLGLIFGSFPGLCEATRRRLLHSDDLDELQRKILAAKGVTRWERVDRDPERIAELDKVREFRRLLAEAEQRHDLSALDDEWGEAGRRLSEAQAALLLAPAPDYKAVRWKLDKLFGPKVTGALADEGRSVPAWDAELTDAIIADMARLGRTV